jgi:hypothetical protein
VSSTAKSVIMRWGSWSERGDDSGGYPRIAGWDQTSTRHFRRPARVRREFGGVCRSLRLAVGSLRGCVAERIWQIASLCFLDTTPFNDGNAGLRVVKILEAKASL